MLGLSFREQNVSLRPSPDGQPAAPPPPPQELSNGLAPPYASTLQVVRHDGSRAPRAAPAKTMKPPVGGGVPWPQPMPVHSRGTGWHACRMQGACMRARRVCDRRGPVKPDSRLRFDRTRAAGAALAPPVQGYCRNVIGGFYTS